ncbi:hypothetical protein Moror_2459 [Moniliophthora roreri MCA 2997]|uniref:Uncharacterized protein n=2 Tax=Moniliophthora roreri TaxID=221103 RepID=V2WZZ3_MONRO|nr:hypothetical protein Moror_2459 [Moniliophthora roreri MCA 2997]KAI3619526.1 hypothetical protein WG66_000742 [Moniliophthora roreri]
MYLSFRLLFFWALLCYFEAFAFVIQAPTPIAAFQQFNWTWEPKDLVFNIGIWLVKDSENCSNAVALNNDFLSGLQPVVFQIGLADVRPEDGGNLKGKESLKVFDGFTGNATLCAYSYSLTQPTEESYSFFSDIKFLALERITIRYTTPNSSSSNLSGGGVAGIVLGIVGFALSAGLYLVYPRFRKRKHINTFHRERMVRVQDALPSMRASSPTVRDTVTVIPKEYISQTQSTSADQSFSALPGEKEELGPKSDIEDGLVPLRKD